MSQIECYSVYARSILMLQKEWLNFKNFITLLLFPNNQSKCECFLCTQEIRVEVKMLMPFIKKCLNWLYFLFLSSNVLSFYHSFILDIFTLKLKPSSSKDGDSQALSEKQDQMPHHKLKKFSKPCINTFFLKKLNKLKNVYGHVNKVVFIVVEELLF